MKDDYQARQHKKQRAMQRRKKERRQRILRAIGIVCAAVFVFLFIVMLTLPKLSSYTPGQAPVTQVMSSDGVEVGTIQAKNRTYVTMDRIPDNLKNAVVAIEDKRFYSHFGIDLFGIARAMINNLKNPDGLEGGSTITQQAARTVYLSNENTLMRKIKEMLMAFKMEAKYSKDEILEIFLNETYFGAGCFGVEEASQRYFSKSVDELTLAQCALIAGLPQAPSAYCPTTEEGLEQALARQKDVLAAMLDQKKITQEEYDEAINEKITISKGSESLLDSGTSLKGFEDFNQLVYEESLSILTDYFKQTQGLSNKTAMEYAETALFSDELTINTTINHALNNLAYTYGKKAVSSSLPDGTTSAIVTMDSYTGAIRAYYGGDQYTDMANEPRQIGSTMKPLYMAYLLENGIADETTLVLDEKKSYGGYTPTNYDGKYRGYVNMRETLVDSINAASVKFFALADTTDIINFVKSYGISTIVDEDYNYAFATGGLTYGISPKEVCAAYCVFNNGGLKVNPYFIESITDKNGNTLYKHQSETLTQILSEQTTITMNSILKDVVNRGTATPAKTDYLTCGKTGTTSDNKDFWFAGSTGNLTTAIWVGNVDNKTISSGSSSLCTNAYRKILTKAVSKNIIAKSELEANEYEDTVTIRILKPGKQANADGSVAKSDTTTVTVTKSQESGYASSRVVEVELCSKTGGLYVEGKCPDKVTAYYLESSVPAQCTSTHLFDNNPFEGWFD